MWDRDFLESISFLLMLCTYMYLGSSLNHVRQPRLEQVETLGGNVLDIRQANPRRKEGSLKLLNISVLFHNERVVKKNDQPRWTTLGPGNLRQVRYPSHSFTGKYRSSSRTMFYLFQIVWCHFFHIGTWIKKIVLTFKSL